jgi:parallel beta-helix repeat protein
MGGSGVSYTNDAWRFVSAGSSVQNPSHTYAAPDIYQVALLAYNAGGWSSTRKPGYINVNPGAPSHIPVTCPAVISSPGTYELQNDCANTPFAYPWDGIKITSSDVVFDGMGHTIDGLGYPPGYTDVHDIYAGTGAALSNIIVKNVTVNGSWQAIYYNTVSNGRIEKVNGRNNGVSIFLLSSRYNKITHCTVTNNGGNAIAIWPGSDYNTITANVADNNNFGFALSDAQNNIVTDNIFENNNYGISLSGGLAMYNSLNGNTIRKNTGYGIYFEETISGTPGSNVFYNNLFFNTANTGFEYATLPLENIWNVTPGTPGPNIIGGSTLGGNYWADPTGTGDSQTCADTDKNGFCDSLHVISFGGNYDNLPLTALTTPADAGNAVRANYPVDLLKQGLYVTPIVMPASLKVRTIGFHSTYTMPDYPGYVAFIDDNPNANWDHAARIVYVEDKKDNPRTAEYKVSSQLADVDLSYNGGMLADPTGDVTTLPPSAPACINPDYSHYYALLLSGGIQKEANYVRYRNDIAFMYQTLRQKYGYPKDHIIVLMSDGNDPGDDQLTGYDSNNNPKYANSITDLDYVPDGISDVNGSATRTNVLQTLDELRSTLHTDDNLFIFTTNHGANMHTGESADPFNGDVILYLWGTGEEGWITDADFVNALPGSPLYPNTGAKSITMVMEQCFGGGFIDNFLDPTSSWNTPKRVISTAADFNEYSWGNAYSFQWISGEWFNPWSMQDAHVNAKLNDRYNTTYSLEHPKFLCTPDTGGTTQYLADCSGAPPAPPSITVTAPKADTWYTGQTRDITWTQTGLSGKKVNIELWKGTATTKTLDIVPPSTLDATKGTQPWLIPATLAAARDYYIKIYQTDASEVFGRSEGSLTINKGRGASTGKLWVNSTPVPNQNAVGAMITIDDVLQKDAAGANILTNASFTLLAGSHDVGVERADYYDVETTSVSVPLAGTWSVNFQLAPIITDDPNDPKYDCVPYGTMEIRSTPEQDAKITILDEGTHKEITGLFTDTKTQIAPGTYTVTVEHDGYLTATQTGVKIEKPPCPAGEERDVIVDFELMSNNVPAIVKIVPRSLNLASKGYFMAFVTLPSDYKAADVIPGSVVCEGATALKLVRHKLFPRTFVAIFRRSDLWDVPTGNSVPMTVEGSIKQTNGNPVFSGSDKIKVISNKVTTKEDVDNWEKMTDEKVFSQFNPGYTKDDEKVFSQSNQKNDKDNGKGSSQSSQRDDNNNVKVYYNGKSR